MTRTSAIGRRGVRVSPLGFGGAPLGNLYTPVSEADALSAIDEALARGIRYFDTAPFYGHGLSEARIGRALAGRPRASFTISTKVGRLISGDDSRREMADGFAVRGSRAVFDYSREGVRRSFEASLERLGVLAGAADPGETYNYAPADESTRGLARSVYEECAAERIDVGAAALQFPLAHPAVPCVVAGMRSAAEVSSAVRRMNTRVPTALWDRLRRRGLVEAAAVLPQ